jgi:hypothetical protein
MVDVKHGLALFSGSYEEINERTERVRRAIDESERGMIMTVLVGKDVSETEAQYMLETRLLPRRVLMRLK